MDELVINNEKLIYLTLKKLKMYHLIDEYYDVGMIGLVKASQHYTSDKGKFSTYACRCIANEILIELRKQKTGKRNAQVVSINQIIYSNGTNNITLEETIISNENIEEDLIEKEQYETMHNLINNLEENDRELIKNYYGVGRKKMTQIELAEITNLSQAQICRRIKNLINKMKQEVE